jgi:dolichol-phosphate mannosyltransferase
MDGDLQHDDTMLPEMLRRLKADRLDLVIGSRYVSGGDSKGLAGRSREMISRLGSRVARLVLNAEPSDPMSGFFVMSRAAFDEIARRLSQQGFKILLDIFASAERPLSFAEVPCRFRARRHGQSKLDTTAVWEFGILVVDKLIGRYLPVRFVVFAGVGATGVVVHLASLGLMGVAGFAFPTALATGVVVAMTWNFILNNIITYRDQRLRGPGFLRGLATFYAIGAVGAFANVGISQMLFELGRRWWLAGVAGALIGVVWNFTMSSFFTWGQRR